RVAAGRPAVEGAAADEALPAKERRGLGRAGLALLAVVALWVLFTVGPGTPLIDETGTPEARLTPFYRSLVAGFFILFLAAGWAYGSAGGTVRIHSGLVQMMSGARGSVAYSPELASAAAHFVATFGWAYLGLILSGHGAAGRNAMALPAPLLLGRIVLFSAFLILS